MIETEGVETVGGLSAHTLGRVLIAGSTGLTRTAESLAGGATGSDNHRRTRGAVPRGRGPRSLGP